MTNTLTQFVGFPDEPAAQNFEWVVRDNVSRYRQAPTQQIQGAIAIVDEVAARVGVELTPITRLFGVACYATGRNRSDAAHTTPKRKEEATHDQDHLPYHG